MTGNKIANKIIKVSKNSQQNNLETVANVHDKKNTQRKIYFSGKKTKNYWWFEIKIIV